MSGKPTGVIVLFLLQLISALIWLVGGALILIPSLLAGDIIAALIGGIFGLILLIVGLILLIIAFGIYGLKSWAWMWAFIFNLLALIVGVLNGFSDLTNVVGIIISAIVVLYLLMPDIRAKFR
jgi:hypothetical protein